MSDPRPAEALSGADDDARIEYLLVTGLDHYFAGEYEHAINLWTRVLFLDRNHDRARAYIDRAHAMGIKVIPWTINDAAVMNDQIDAGADGIITDYPTRLRSVMAARGMPLPPAYHRAG